MRKLKLITEAESANYDLQFVYEQANTDSEKKLYVSGIYMVQNNENRNQRTYYGEDMEPAVDKFVKEYVNRNRGCGTLNHDNSPEIDLNKICHRITSLHREGDAYIGKSLVASTPSGKVMSTLISDGFAIGMSSKSLGRVEESSTGKSRVRDIAILSVDCVYDPSIGGSLNNPNTGFVKGILENKEFIISQLDGEQLALSGVSLDEEMVNLIKFQNSYQASARFISTISQMMDVLLNI